METNVNYSLVGAFVITLIAALVFAIIWLSSGLSLKQYSIYMIHMQESVSGLSIDSTVEYNGVGIGTVKSIELSEINPKVVDVLLNINSQTPINVSTVATLKTRGMTGITFISLQDKGNNRAALVALPGNRYPIITTVPSLFVRVDTALSELSQNVGQVTTALKTLLDTDNLANIKASLVSLNILLRDTSKASQQLNPLLQSSTNTARILETQTLPQTYRLLSNLNDVTRTLSQVSDQIRQNPAVLIRGAAQPALGPGETR